MRIAEINMVHVGSTGRIMMGIADSVRAEGYAANTYSARYYQRNGRAEFPEHSNHTYFGLPAENMIHLRLGQLTGMIGCFSHGGTYQLITELDRFKPDIVHLHNLHNSSINVPILFGYLKKKQIKVVWTLHDCWAFTGQCPHFVVAKCNKWIGGCHHCPRLGEYPKSFVDNTKFMYQLKKKWFSGLNELLLVTPSVWLAGLVKKSFLKDYPVKVIHNGIDLSAFKPTESNFRIKHHIPPEKHIVLGVAFGWGYKKGLDAFVKLADSLGDSYQIVLVGTDENVDRQLPKNIVSVHRTNDVRELAEIYSAANVFVNPTREDTFPSVNIESLACGTPVITFCTGGSPEIVDETCGSVVEGDDLNALEREIMRICSERPYTPECCVQRAKEFDQADRFKEYVSLYREIMSR